MLNQTSLNQIKKTVKEFFNKMDIPVEIRLASQQEKTLPINLKAEEPLVLIGERGRTLSDIQRLLASILRKNIEEPFYLDLDVNDYKKKKAEYLKETAISLADDVALTKKEKQLPPMTASERRVIHLTLADRADVATESMGEDPRRYVIIRSSS